MKDKKTGRKRENKTNERTNEQTGEQDRKYRARKNVQCPFLTTPGLAEVEEVLCPHFFGELAVRYLAEEADMEPDSFINIIACGGEGWKATGLSEEECKLVYLYITKQIELLEIVMMMKKAFELDFDITPDYGDGRDAYI